MDKLTFAQKRRISLIASRGAIVNIGLNTSMNKFCKYVKKNYKDMDFDNFLRDFNFHINHVKLQILNYFHIFSKKGVLIPNNLYVLTDDYKDMISAIDYSLCRYCFYINFIALFKSYIANLVKIYNLIFDDSILLENREKTFDVFVGHLTLSKEYIR